MFAFIKEIQDRDKLIQNLIMVDRNVLKIKGHHLPVEDMRNFFGLTEDEIVTLNKLIKEYTIEQKKNKLNEDF